MTTAHAFGQHCRLTCLGGSERGTCDCVCPNECALKVSPDFKMWRQRAIERLVRHGINWVTLHKNK